MLSPAEYRAVAVAARAMAEEYRSDADAEKDFFRRVYLLKNAVEREEYADFYEDRALINEDYERRHAPKQEKAA